MEGSKSENLEIRFLAREKKETAQLNANDNRFSHHASI